MRCAEVPLCHLDVAVSLQHIVLAVANIYFLPQYLYTPIGQKSQEQLEKFPDAPNPDISAKIFSEDSQRK
jgi:hypothetical protein